MESDTASIPLEHDTVSELLAEVGSCFVHVDAEGTVIAWGEDCEKLLEHAGVDAVHSLNLAQLFTDQAEGEALLLELVETGRAETMGQMVKASGGTFVAKAVFSITSQEDVYVGVINDASEQQQSQENFNYLRVYLDTVLGISGDAIITSDLDGIIMMFNEGAEAIFNMATIEALGENMFDLLFAEKDVGSVRTSLQEDGHVRDRESRVTFPDGTEAYLEVTISKTRDISDQESGLIAIIRDTTARKRLEDERLQSEVVQQEMRIARGVQLTMLPDNPPVIEGLDIGARIEFCEDIGGDLFDFSRLRSGKLGVSIGDVSDHGVGPAIVMSSSKAMINALEQYTEQLARMFALLNNLLEQSTEDERFITLFYGLIDPPNRTMEYVNAGHDSPIIYRKATGEFEELESTGMALGIAPEQEYSVGGPVQFNSGDMMLLTTDGIWEAMNPDKKAFGKDRVYELMTDMQAEPCQEILDELFERVKKHCAGEEVKDDQTAVLLRFVPPPGRQGNT